MIKRKDVRIMKLSQFINRLDKFDFVSKVELNENETSVTVYGDSNDTIMVIDNEHEYSLNTFYLGFYQLSDYQKSILMDYGGRLISTPLKEREDEELFVVPIIPATFKLKPKYLFKGISGLTMRDLTKEQIKNNEVDPRFIFSKSQIETMRKDDEMNINFDKAQKVERNNQNLQPIFK